MQSTHKIPGSSATTWSRYLLTQASRGDYYTHDGEGGKSAPTKWHGPEALLRSYGIDPAKSVELKDLRSLMHGFSPVDGGPIRPAGSDKTRVAGIDLTFSPPKTVSALWATSGPYRRAQIEVAHREAVQSTLERTEHDVAVVRRRPTASFATSGPSGCSPLSPSTRPAVSRRIRTRRGSPTRSCTLTSR